MIHQFNLIYYPRMSDPWHLFISYRLVLSDARVTRLQATLTALSIELKLSSLVFFPAGELQLADIEISKGIRSLFLSNQDIYLGGCLPLESRAPLAAARICFRFSSCSSDLTFAGNLS